MSFTWSKPNIMEQQEVSMCCSL